MYKLVKLATLNEHTDRVWCCAWSPGGTALATCSSDKTIRVWKRKTVISSNIEENDLNEVSGSICAQIDPNDFTNNKVLVESPLACPYSPSQPLSLNDWVCIQVIETEHRRTIRSVAWSPSGRHIAAASFDNTISIWELIDGCFECVATLEGHESEVKGVSWCSSGDMIVSCSRDKAVWVWQADCDQEWECLAVLTGHTQDIKGVSFHPHSEDIISVSYDNSVRVWELQDDDWYNTQIMEDAKSTVWDLAFDNSAKYLATVSDDKCLRVYSHDENAPSSRQWKSNATVKNAHDRAIYSVSWSKPMVVPGTMKSHANTVLNDESGFIATCGGDDKIRIVKPITSSSSINIAEISENAQIHAEKGGKPILSIDDCLTVSGHEEDINCVAWNPKVANILASAGDDGVINIWRFEAVQDTQ